MSDRLTPEELTQLSGLDFVATRMNPDQITAHMAVACLTYMAGGEVVVPADLPARLDSHWPALHIAAAPDGSVTYTVEARR